MNSKQCATPWTADPFPGRFFVPTMLTQREVHYLHWLSHTWCEGAGRVIELGCFLGGSTMALATGLGSNPRALRPMLTYDSFEMDAFAATLPQHPYKAGECFRPLFDIFLKDHLHNIVVREGWIPNNLPVEREPELYPEQEPVEVLFIDAAKTWACHLTMLRTFGRHLVEGRSIVVQQDFKNFYAHWLPIHMHQLRDCFEPVHDVPLSATYAFRYIGGLDAYLDRLLQPVDIGVEGIDDAWDEIEAFWEPRNAGEAMVTILLNRAAHFASRKSFDGAFAALNRFIERYPALAESTPGHASIAAREFARTVDLLEGVAGNDKGRLAATAALRQSGPIRLHTGPGAMVSSSQAALWRQVALRCAEAGIRRIALYGAGAHTRQMLSSGWPDGRLEVVAIIDDAPSVASMHGVGVMRPAELAEDVDGVVLSSDSMEATLRDAAERAFGEQGLPIVSIYDPQPMRQTLSR